jgi:ribosome modulation factor
MVGCASFGPIVRRYDESLGRGAVSINDKNERMMMRMSGVMILLGIVFVGSVIGEILLGGSDPIMWLLALLSGIGFFACVIDAMIRCAREGGDAYRFGESEVEAKSKCPYDLRCGRRRALWFKGWRDEAILCTKIVKMTMPSNDHWNEAMRMATIAEVTNDIGAKGLAIRLDMIKRSLLAQMGEETKGKEN